MSSIPLPGLKEMIESISRDRNLPKLAVQEALREALMKGYERFRRTQRMEGHAFDEEYFDRFEVELDIEEEGFRVLATKTIVEEVTNPDHEIDLKEVQEVADEAQAGDAVVVDVTPDQNDFGRMAAIQTKQVLSQKLRDQQRKMIQEEFQELEGAIMNARILRFERQSVIMSVSSGFGQPEVEAELLKRDQLPNDNYRANATLKVYLKKVSEGAHRGPQLLVSRADAGLVVYLFENEVPEIQDDVVRIVAVAREANPPSRFVGPRTKIAVDTLERDVDPVGACIGARGSRIQAVVNELKGEKIDVIRWSPDPATYISNALSPARVHEVRLMDPEGRQAHVLVGEDQLSLAIGKEGQNVRLAARLTGWKIDIKDVNRYDYVGEDSRMHEILEARAAEQAARAKDEEENDDYEDDDYEENDQDDEADTDAVTEADSEVTAVSQASTSRAAITEPESDEDDDEEDEEEDDDDDEEDDDDDEEDDDDDDDDEEDAKR
jgi:transcription termination/antitermination protein NusA